MTEVVRYNYLRFSLKPVHMYVQYWTHATHYSKACGTFRNMGLLDLKTHSNRPWKTATWKNLSCTLYHRQCKIVVELAVTSAWIFSCSIFRQAHVHFFSIHIMHAISSVIAGGGCWAYTAAAVTESAWLITRNMTAVDVDIDLSEQQLIDCANADAGFISYGCDG